MAKTEKKISIANFDKVLKENSVGVVTEQWHGNEIKIRHTLPLTEMLAFVNEVASGCFQEAGGYMPELCDFLIRSNILTRYANFSLPDKLEHRYSLLYETDAVNVVMAHINDEQFNEITAAIRDKMDYLCRSNINAVEKRLEEATEALTGLQEKCEEAFSGITPNDIKKITSAFADGRLSEDRIVKAYADYIRSGTGEHREQTEQVG